MNIFYLVRTLTAKSPPAIRKNGVVDGVERLRRDGCYRLDDIMPERLDYILADCAVCFLRSVADRLMVRVMTVRVVMMRGDMGVVPSDVMVMMPSHFI